MPKKRVCSRLFLFALHVARVGFMAFMSKWIERDSITCHSFYALFGSLFYEMTVSNVSVAQH